MISFFINFLLNTISESHLGAQILIVGGIIVVVCILAAKIYKVAPQLYEKGKNFILTRETKRRVAEETQQKILSNQDNILNNYKNVETLTLSVADIAKLTNKISDENRQIGSIIEQMLGRLDALETEVPKLKDISDGRDNELINVIKSQTDKLEIITNRLNELSDMVALLNDSSTEDFRHKLMFIYKETLTNGGKIELHVYQDLHKGIQRYFRQHGNSYAKEVWEEISKCEKVIDFPELYNDEISEEFHHDLKKEKKETI